MERLKIKMENKITHATDIFKFDFSILI